MQKVFSNLECAYKKKNLSYTKIKTQMGSVCGYSENLL